MVAAVCTVSQGKAYQMHTTFRESAAYPLGSKDHAHVVVERAGGNVRAAVVVADGRLGHVGAPQHAQHNLHAEPTDAGTTV
jgi:hypothetical protein